MSNQEESQNGGTIVGSNVKLTGVLKDINDIIIHGKVEGEIESQKSVVISENASAKGPITADQIIISGSVNGSVTAHTKFELLPGGNVSGSITTKDLVIQSGALFNGKCIMIAGNEKNIEVKPEITPVQKTNPETTGTIKSHETGNGKNIRNISIKAGLRSIKEQSISEENQPEPIIDNPFTQEKLEESWTNFCKSYEGISPSFANALAKYTPHLGSNNQITYTVDSIQIIQNSLSVNQLMEHLKRELNNNQITLQAIVPDKNQTKKAYTDRDKLERLIEKNPNVQKLKDQFNLEIGF